jgi:hypothetical protein
MINIHIQPSNGLLRNIRKGVFIEVNNLGRRAMYNELKKTLENLTLKELGQCYTN